MKQLIVNADDFGLCESVNQGIIKGARDGVITSTSMLVNMDYSLHAASLLDDTLELGVGLHVNITKGKPVSNPQDIPSLVDEDGNFLASGWYLQENHSVHVDDLIREFDQQYHRFIALTNRKPDHINIHHIYDFYGNYPALFDHVINSYHLPLRLFEDNQSSDYSFPNIKKIDSLDASVITKEVYLEKLKHTKANIVEIAMHPGYVDETLKQLSSMTQDRLCDLEVVLDPEFKQQVEAFGFHFAKFSDIKEVKK
ncbi:MAG: carbohydrate deacetylase [Erysipelotrichaceae bacterium]